ncbi:UNVERIFIED_CONTAM: hypothetical protein GTU68_023766 [Idotea baltica]|nr:hypothetical protein [Idotea baltica]
MCRDRTSAQHCRFPCQRRSRKNWHHFPSGRLRRAWHADGKESHSSHPTGRVAGTLRRPRGRQSSPHYLPKVRQNRRCRLRGQRDTVPHRKRRSRLQNR